MTTPGKDHHGGWTPEQRNRQLVALVDVLELLQRPELCMACGCLCRADELCPACLSMARVAKDGGPPA